MVWVEDQTSHNITVSQKPNPKQGQTPFNSLKTEREEAAEEKFEVGRD